MTLKRRQFLTSAAAAGVLLPGIARAAEPEVFQTNGVAINGADPVAYFTQDKVAIAGKTHSLMWRGAHWQFDTAQALAAFESDPEKYAPLFGGYCAYAASLGYLAPTIPEAYTVYEGRLYLNANLRAQKLWRRDIPGNIAKGLANWPGILG